MSAMAEERSVFENEEWLVTASGLEHKGTGYFIARASLGDRRGDGLWSWPLHMAEKSWCAMAPFAEAFSCAAAFYRVGTDIDLARTFRIARSEISPWPDGGRRDDSAPNPVPALLRALQKDARDPIYIEPGFSEKPLKNQNLRNSEEIWRRPGPDSVRAVPPRTRHRPSRFDPTNAAALGGQAPHRLRRTGTKLVKLIQAAWNIK